MSMRRLTLQALDGLPLIAPGDDLAALLAGAVRRMQIVPENGDVIVVAQKVVSKAEGRLVDLDGIKPSPRAFALAREVGKDARLVEVILRESTEVVRHKKDVLIVAHRLGFVMANAGVDQSNVDPDTVALLPEDSDRSARAFRERVLALTRADVAVIIADTFGRPWREGLTNVAIGLDGIAALRDYIGAPDSAGRPLQATILAVADELASAAEIVMGKLDRIPAAIVRGLSFETGPAGSKPLLRDPARDLFR